MLFININFKLYIPMRSSNCLFFGFTFIRLSLCFFSLLFSYLFFLDFILTWILAWGLFIKNNFLIIRRILIVIIRFVIHFFLILFICATFILKSIICILLVYWFICIVFITFNFRIIFWLFRIFIFSEFLLNFPLWFNYFTFIFILF